MNNTLIKIARRFQYKLFVYAQAARSLIALKNKYPELKDKLNNGKYTNILSEEVSSQNKVYSDNEMLKFPFILYTIKLK